MTDDDLGQGEIVRALKRIEHGLETLRVETKDRFEKYVLRAEFEAYIKSYEKSMLDETLTMQRILERQDKQDDRGRNLLVAVVFELLAITTGLLYILLGGSPK